MQSEFENLAKILDESEEEQELSHLGHKPFLC